MSAKKISCSFCGKDESDAKEFVKGANAIICDECIELCHTILSKKKTVHAIDKGTSKEPPVPEEIHRKLNVKVIGQDQAKKVISVAVYNHYKRLLYKERGSQKVELDKSNILLIGPTGTGKTLIAKTLAEILDVPFAIADATSLTQAGYIGEDVEAVLTRLLHKANYDVAQAERGIIYLDEVDKIGRKEGYSSFNRDVSGEGVQQALLKILEGTEALVPKELGAKGGNAGYVSMNTGNILFICGGSFEGVEEGVRKRTKKKSMGFGVMPTSREDRDKERDELVRHLIPDDLIEFGMMPEFVGRVPVVATLHHLDRTMLRRILFEPESSLIRQYKELLWMDKVELAFTDQAIAAIIEKTVEERTGARGLRSILERVMLDVMYQVPSKRHIDRYIVTQQEVQQRLDPGFRPEGNDEDEAGERNEDEQAVEAEVAKARG